jgi:hypothetical protein
MLVQVSSRAAVIRRRFLAATRWWRRHRQWSMYTFIAFGPTLQRRKPTGTLRYSFRFDRVRRAIVDVEGGSPKWRERMTSELAAQGYEQMATSRARVIANAREQRRELQWLAAFSSSEIPPRPAPRRAATPEVATWKDVDRVVGCGIAWSELVAGVLRRGRFGDWHALAAMVVIVESDGEVRRSAYVQVYSNDEAPSIRSQRRLAAVLQTLPQGSERIMLQPFCMWMTWDELSEAAFRAKRRDIDAWIRDVGMKVIDSV